MRLTVVGCSPAWPNPNGGPVGLPDRGRTGAGSCSTAGPAVLGRLRTSEAWPDFDAVVITHFHLDHWGDLVPWVWGALYLHGRGENPPRPELWVPPGGIELLARFGAMLGFPDMFERVFRPFEFTPGVEFGAGGCTVTATAVPHYRMEAFALRVAAEGRTLAYSGDSGPSDDLAACAAGADLFVCEATLLRGRALTGSPGADSVPRGGGADGVHVLPRASELLVTHRPCELPGDDALSFAFDGLCRSV